MKTFLFSILFVVCFHFASEAQTMFNYLDSIKSELSMERGRTINLVFHGHSVPAGFAQTPFIRTFDSYPYQLLKQLKQEFPYAQVNIIVTARGGETSVQGAARFDRDVLIYRPDVLFIDYALNDPIVGLDSSRWAMDQMVKKALAHNIKVVLLTPSPNLQDNFDASSVLLKYDRQIVQIAKDNHIPFANVYQTFKNEIASRNDIREYMAQYNHPNEKGNAVIADELFKFFTYNPKPLAIERCKFSTSMSINAKVYPGRNICVIELMDPNLSLTAELYDKMGKLIEKREISQTKTEISTNQYKNNPCLLMLHDNTTNASESYRIVRN